MRLKTLGIYTLLAAALAVPTVLAQAPSDIVKNVQFEKIDLAPVLDTLIGTRKGSFLVRPGVDGQVSLNQKAKGLGPLLDSVAEQLNAKVLFRNGIYELVPKIAPPLPEDPATAIIPAVDFEKVNVRSALKALFSSVNTSYSVDPSVEGTVTLSLRYQSVETVLRNVLQQVSATYRVEAGVYQIVRREDPFIKEQKPSSDISLSLYDVPVRDALKQLGIEFTIDPAVTGSVTLVAENKPFETVLGLMLRQLDASYRVEGGVYQIIPNKPVASQQEAPKAVSGQQTMMVDGRYLYILRGDQLLKLDKETLEIVAKTELPGAGK